MFEQAACLRLACDVIYSDVCRLLGGSQCCLQRSQFNENTRLDEYGLGLDSLNRLVISKEFALRFDMESTGLDDFLVVTKTIGGWAEILKSHFEIAGMEASVNFFTSGTSGQPKLVNHKLSKLCHEKNFLELEVMGDRSRVVSLVSSHHLYGFLLTLLAPQHCGLEVLDLSSESKLEFPKFASRGDCIVGVPSFYEHSLKRCQSMCKDVRLVSSSEVLTQGLWKKISKGFADDIFEIYGSSETGGVGFRRSPRDPFQLFPYLKREGTCILHNGKKLPLQDKLLWREGEEKFYLGGRLDGAVSVAGVNVSLSHVRDVLLSSGLVVDAAVLYTNGRLSARVKVDSDSGIDRWHVEKELRTIAGSLLSPSSRPVLYHVARG